MTRIEPVAAPFSPALQQRFERLLPPGTQPPAIFRAVARNEPLFLELVDSGLLGPTGLLDRRGLPPPLRELLILRTCAAARNDYQWHLHADTLARRMGLTPAQIADTREETPTPALWSQAERTAMLLADKLVGWLDVDDALYATLREHFDDAQLLEMTLLVGLYTSVAMLVALARPERDGPSRKKM